MFGIKLFLLSIVTFLPTCIIAGEYSTTENVVSLNSSTFNAVTGSGRWLILFYRRSCPGCQKFSPIFKSAALHLRNWDNILRVGAVDCESQNNQDVCIAQKIDAVPRLKYFNNDGIHDRSNNDGIILAHSMNVSLVISQLVEQLAKEMKENLNDPQYETIRSLISVEGLNGDRKKEDHITKNDSRIVVSTKDQLWKVYADDIFISLSSLLYIDVSMITKIENEELSALREFLMMLTRVLPCSEFYRRNLIELYNWVNSQQALTGRAWADKLNEMKFPLHRGDHIACNGSAPRFRGNPCGLWILFHSLTVRHYELSQHDSNLPGNLVAHALNRFMPRFFACLECAFHFAANTANIALVNEAYLPVNRPMPPSSDFHWDPAIISILPKAPTTAYEEVIWLNRVHNRVNARLAGSITEDPAAPKIQYPPEHLCPNCWRNSESGTKSLGDTAETEANLFRYLIEHYQSSSWLTVKLPPSFFTNTDNQKLAAG